MRPYVIRQGDYLTKLAHTMGFEADSIWEHPKNEQLRQKRPNKNLLHPGDILWVPDAAEHRRLVIHEGTTNRYVARVPGVYIAVKLQVGGEPLAKEPFRIMGLGEPIEGETDEKGYVRAGVPVHVREIEVYLPERDRTLRLRVGDLDPVDTVSGIKKRLMHLGYYQPTRVGVENEGVDGEALVSALKSFQSDKGLAPSGKVDEDTSKALTGDHGS